MNAFYSSITNTTAIQIESVDLCISPDLSRFNLIDFDQVPDLLDVGYTEALSALKAWVEGSE